jgi:hypothetical protein
MRAVAPRLDMLAHELILSHHWLEKDAFAKKEEIRDIIRNMRGVRGVR